MHPFSKYFPNLQYRIANHALQEQKGKSFRRRQFTFKTLHKSYHLSPALLSEHVSSCERESWYVICNVKSYIFMYIPATIKLNVGSKMTRAGKWQKKRPLLLLKRMWRYDLGPRKTSKSIAQKVISTAGGNSYLTLCSSTSCCYPTTTFEVPSWGDACQKELFPLLCNQSWSLSRAGINLKAQI